MDRPYAISVLVRNSDSRPVIIFPDIAGLTKRGTSTSITSSEQDGETVISQVITQTYAATQPGTIRIAPFVITVNGTPVRSEGAVLTVRPAAGSVDNNSVALPQRIPTESGAAFLSLTPSKTSVYVGEGFGMRLSLFVSDMYPFELRFDGVDAQLQTLLKKLRPTNAWEEDAGIRELKGRPVVINKRKFTEYVIFQGTFFPLSTQPITIPAVGLNLVRVRPAGRVPEPAVTTGATNATSSSTVAGTASIGTTRKTPPAPAKLSKSAAGLVEQVPFLTSSFAITVRPLPPHPLRGQVAVGTYRLVERADRTAVVAGKSTRYSIQIEGEGNIASLQAPLISNWGSTTAGAIPAVSGSEIELLPAGSGLRIDRTSNRITGNKSFAYFLVPRRAGTIDLGQVFGLIVFDPRTARYDTLTAQTSLRVREGGPEETSRLNADVSGKTTAADALYAGLNQLDSTRQPVNFIMLIRAIANVLLVLMILGMIFVFLRK